MNQNPTSEAYDELQAAYLMINERLFHGILPLALITLQRKKHTYGYFSENRFVKRTGETVDEIALNPSFFATRSISEVLSTLGHEMVHLWQFKFGKPGRGRYHNKEWAIKMEEIGLMPSNTGKEGGRKTGDQMTHYIIDGGAFNELCEVLLTKEFTISWLDRFSELTPRQQRPSLDPDVETQIDTLGINVDTDTGTKTNRAKYSHICSDGKASNLWGRHGFSLTCKICGSDYEEEG